MVRKLVKKCCACIKKPAQEENRSLAELARAGKLDAHTAVQALHRADLKKAGLIAGGTLLALGVLNAVSQYRFYRSAISRELKKQLAPLDRKLDALQAENEQLRAELEQCRAEQPAAH